MIHPTSTNVASDIDEVSKSIVLRRYDIPAIRGIYFLLHLGAVVYVGKSENIARRIGVHLADTTKDFDAVYYFPWDGNLGEIEMHWIRKLRPKYNGKRRFHSI